MTRWISKLNGWALSLLLHGLVAALAALSVLGVSSGGGSGWGSGGGATGGGGSLDAHEASLRSENIVSGEPLGDPVQYGRLTEDVQDPLPADELPPPVRPFDVFAVGAAEVPPPATPPVLSDPLQSRPAPAAERAAKLPAAGTTDGPGSDPDNLPGNADDAGPGGPGGSGGGSSGGSGQGQGAGMGDGQATGVYTPAPAYPGDARRLRIQGAVLVELAIDADGGCTLGRIVESSGSDLLDNAAAAAVSRWKYRSASADGRPDRTTKRIRFVFKLNDRDRRP